MTSLVLYLLAYTMITYAVGYHMGYTDGKAIKKAEENSPGLETTNESSVNTKRI